MQENLKPEVLVWKKLVSHEYLDTVTGSSPVNIVVWRGTCHARSSRPIIPLLSHPVKDVSIAIS